MSYDAPPPPPPPSYGQPMYGGAPGGDGGDALRGATIQQAFQRFWGKYADFNGRASRSEYWFAVLANFIVELIGLIVLGVLSALVGRWILILYYLYGLAVIVPSLALATRRLHDTGKSGWWQLINFTCIGVILLIVWFASPPTAEGAKYNNA